MRFSVRVQAERHSAFVMWVPLSQNPMQASMVSPPPPAVLGEDSLGLVLVAVGEVTVSVRAVPPLEAIVEAGGGDSGATAVVWGIAVPIAERGSVPADTLGAGGGVAVAAAMALAAATLVCDLTDVVAGEVGWRETAAGERTPMLPRLPRASAMAGASRTARLTAKAATRV
jgi:hypothetical protein